MKTMKKLQVAAAAASLFAAAGLANAATLNSSGSVIAAETIFPTGVNATLGNNTRIKAPAFTYQYEGGVVASSRQTFKVAVNLTGGAQWATDTTRRDSDPLIPVFNPGRSGPPTAAGLPVGDGRFARTIIATATVNGTRARVAVVPNEAPVIPNGTFGLILLRVESGDTIQGSPLQSSPTSAITFVFELVNNTPQNGVSLDQLALQFSTFKPSEAPPPGLMHPLSAPDSATQEVDNYPTIYNLASLSVDTNNAACLEPSGSVRLQAVSGNNDPAVLSQEDTTSNQGTLRDVGNYIIIRRATRMDLAKGGDRLVATTNSFQTNLGTTPVNGIGGTGGGRTTFRPSTIQTANVFGGNNTGAYDVNNNLNGVGNATGRPAETHPERRTSGDERIATLGTLTFQNVGSALDRLIDLDSYGFKPQIDPQPTPGNSVSHRPSGPGQVGDLTVVGPVAAPANVFGGVDIALTAPTATPVSGAVVIRFTSRPNFSGFAGGAPGFGTTSRLTLQRGPVCSENPVGGINVVGSLLNPNQGADYIWRFSAAELAVPDNTLLGQWSVCYRVDGETTIPATTFTNVSAVMLKDDSTEQGLTACTAELASIYGGVMIDVRNFNLHAALPNANADQQRWIGILRLINNSESETATVEGQFIHNDGRYGPWGAIAAGPATDPTGGALGPRAARYVTSAQIYSWLTNPVANPTTEVLNNRPTAETTRIRISADVSTLRVQNYVFHTGTQALTELSGAQGADFLNINSSNRDHIDQDAQFDIVKDARTLGQRQLSSNPAPAPAQQFVVPKPVITNP